MQRLFEAVQEAPRATALPWFLVALVIVCPILTIGCNSSELKPVLDWFVGFAKAAGEFVVEKATVFAQALKRAWLAFAGENMNVDPDPDDPLKGRYLGELRCKVAWGESNELSVKLDSPKMVRSSSDSEVWELAPEEKELIENLQQELLSAS